MEISNKILLRKRTVIEFVNDFLKNICQIKHSRHKSCCHFVINLVSGIIAYSSGLQPYINPFCFSSCNISTHTPLVGCNHQAEFYPLLLHHFYSHTPCGVQHILPVKSFIFSHFYSHTPCGVQRCNLKCHAHTPDFYSHTPCGVQLFPFKYSFCQS